MAYNSSWSPAIKVTRAVLYTLLLVSSIGLIVSSLKFGVVRGQPKYHPDEAITLAHGQDQALFARKTSIDLTSIVFPTQTHTHKQHSPSPSSTGGVVSSYKSKASSSVAATSRASASASASASSTKTKETGISKTSWKASPTGHHGRPHPSSFPEPGGTWTYCKTNKARLTYIAVAGLVSSTLVLSLLFFFPTAYSTFLSQFWFELVVVEILLLAWAVVAFLATKEARLLDECTRDTWRKPALLAFAWSGFVLNLLAMVGLLAIALLEKSRGNDHIWKAKLNNYIFGERGIRLDDDAESRPILGQ
ncbi:hypothetical protein BDY24DRAFT_378249 [Mrakia frigida]|uniref:uncharacterized protein n=1 Tax=Mrakia frigida TaxID=29902 RepID=UPI003FCC0C99